MIWCACYLLFVLLDEFGYRGKSVGLSIASYCLFATLVTSRNKGSTQFYMFQTSQV